MSIADSVYDIINSYGNEVAVSDGVLDLGRTKAFIQPLRYKNRMYLDGKFLEGGYNSGRHYLYIGLPEIRIDKDFEGVVITTEKNQEYIVKQAELYSFGDAPVYIWAILTPYSKEWDDG